MENQWNSVTWKPKSPSPKDKHFWKIFKSFQKEKNTFKHICILRFKKLRDIQWNFLYSTDFQPLKPHFCLEIFSVWPKYVQKYVDVGMCLYSFLFVHTLWNTKYITLYFAFFPSIIYLRAILIPVELSHSFEQLCSTIPKWLYHILCSQSRVDGILGSLKFFTNVKMLNSFCKLFYTCSNVFVG